MTVGKLSLLDRLRGPSDHVTSVAVTSQPGKPSLAVSVGCRDGHIYVWPRLTVGHRASDSTLSCPPIRLSGHGEDVNAVDIAPTQTVKLLAVSASRDQTVRLWHPSASVHMTKTGRDKDQAVHTMRGHSASVRFVEFDGKSSCGGGPKSPDRLVTCSDDKSIKLWSVVRHKVLSSFAEHANWVRCARFNPSSSALIASVGDDKTVRVFDDRSSKSVLVIPDSAGAAAANHLAFHPSGSCVSLACCDGKVRILELRMRKLIQLYDKLHSSAASQSTFHPSGNYLASVATDGSAHLVDLLEARSVSNFAPAHGPAVKAVQFGPDVDRVFEVNGGGTDRCPLFTAGQDCRLSVWQTDLRPTGACRATLPSELASKVETRTAHAADNVDAEYPKSAALAPGQATHDLLRQIDNKLQILANSTVLMEKRISAIERRLSMD